MCGICGTFGPVSDDADRDFGEDATVRSESTPGSGLPPRAEVGQRTEASGGSTWEDDGLDRTAHASDLAQLSLAFERRFSSWRSGSDPQLGISLSTPDERTGGGVQGRQQLVLQACEEGRSERIPVGWVDLLSSRGAIRTYAEVSTEYTRRFKTNLSTSAPQFEQLVDEMERFFSARRIVFEPSAPLPRAPSRLESHVGTVEKRDLGALWIPLAFGLGLLAAYLVFQR